MAGPVSEAGSATVSPLSGPPRHPSGLRGIPQILDLRHSVPGKENKNTNVHGIDFH